MTGTGAKSAVASVTVFALALVLYVTCAPHWYSGDDLQYAALVEEAVTGSPIYHPTAGSPYIGQRRLARTVPFNPRYPLDFPSSVAAVRIEGYLRGEVDSLRALRAFRAFAGAIVVAFFFAIVRRATRDSLLAAAGAAAVGFSAATWTYSTHVDQTMNSVALLIMGLFVGLVARTSRRPTRAVLGLAVLLALATLYNLLAVIPALVIGVATMVALPVSSRAERVRAAAAAAVVFALTALGGLVGLAATFDPSANLVSREYWRAASFAGRPEYAIDVPQDLALAALGFARSIASHPGLGSATLHDYWRGASTGSQVLTLGIYGGMLVAATVLTVSLAVRFRSQAVTRWVYVVAALWFSLTALFNVWWDPTYTKYWVSPLVAWWLLTVVGLSTVWRRTAVVGLLGSAAVVLAVANGATLWWPHRSPEENRFLVAAHELRASHPDALFISVDQPIAYSLDFYISYFTRRDIVSTTIVAYGGGSAAITPVLRKRVRVHRSLRGPIFVFGLPSASKAHVDAVRAALPPGRFEPAWDLGWTKVMRFVHQPV